MTKFIKLSQFDELYLSPDSLTKIVLINIRHIIFIKSEDFEGSNGQYTEVKLIGSITIYVAESIRSISAMLEVNNNTTPEIM